MAPPLQMGCGNRGGLIGNHRTNAARTDQGLTALITDLKARECSMKP